MSWAPRRTGQRKLYPRLTPFVIISLFFLTLTFGCGGGSASSPPPPPPPPAFQPRAFPGDYAMRLPTAAFDGPIPSEAYDPSLKEIFISDPNFNSVEVYSTTNGKFVGEISIPAPAGLGFSPDFSQLFVGTITPYVYLVDPVALHVTAQIQVPASQLSANAQGATMMPVMPFAMADGSIVLGMGLAPQSGSSTGIGVAHLLRYVPGGNTFTSIDPGQSGTQAEARSQDGNYLVVSGVGNSGLELVIYSVATQSYLSASGALQNPAVFLAANEDGSQFASVQDVGTSNSQVNFWGSSLQSQSQYTINGAVTGAIYSRDGKSLYVMTDLGYLVALNTQSAAPTGYVGLAIAAYPGPPPIYDVDETLHLFGAAQGGAFILNASQSQSSPPSAMPQFVGSPSTEANPNVGPVSGDTQVQFIPAPNGAGSADGIASSMEAYFGATPAPLDSVGPYPSSSDGENFLTATTPPATAPGPVPVVLTDANNNTVFMPDAFTYGPHILRIEPNTASTAGGDQLAISAYGLGFFDIQDIKVSIGGVLASNVTLNSYASTNYPEQSVTISVPPGTAGWADVVLTTSNGSDTLKRGIQYLSQEVSVAGGPFSFAVYDSTRNLFYLSGSGNSVAVFNPRTQALQLPLQSSLVSAGAVLQAMALTPDNSTLLVADATDQLVIAFNLVANTSTKFSVALPSDPTGTPVTPRTIVTAAQNRVFVSVTPCATDPVREIDLANLTVQARPDATSTCSTYGPYPELGSGSADGSTLVYAGNSGDLFGVSPPGPEYLWRYTASSDSFSGPVIIADLPWVGGQAALSRDGGVIALSQGVLDQQLMPLVPLLQPREDARLNETGSLLYGVGLESNEIVLSDVHNGRWVLKLVAQNSNGTVIGLGPIRSLAIDATGTQILLGLKDGIAYFQLATVPLAVGTISPATAPSGGTIQLNGSGFVAGTIATIGGKGAACTQVNTEALSCTVPTLAAGSASISLTNPDGQTYSLENAFVVQ